MNILITGSSGFVGSALLRHISKQKSKDRVCLLSSKKDNRYCTYLYTNDDSGYHFNIPSDVDVLIHLGSWTPKSTNVANDYNRSFSNILFTYELLKKLFGLNKVVFISTLDVYAPTALPINEESTIGPISLYGSSKLYCEDMIRAWANDNSVDLCILRLGHIYGIGEQQYKKLIPTLITQAINNHAINIFTDGQEKRSFFNVDNCVDVIWRAAHDDSKGIYNVTSGNPYSVVEIATKIKSLACSDSIINILNNVSDARDCVFDNSKLLKQFQVQETPLDEGLKAEIDYLRTLEE